MRIGTLDLVHESLEGIVRDRIIAFVLGAALGLGSGIMASHFMGPSNYDDCMLDVLKSSSGGYTEMAFGAARMSCGRKFTETTPEDVKKRLGL